MGKINKQTDIVIVGAGFGGVTVLSKIAALVNARRIKNARIIFVDRKDYHLYYPNIYEVASSEEEFASVDNLKQSVALPIKEILPQPARFHQGELEAVNQAENCVLVSGQRLDYDYLVLALGSVSDDFGISGVAEHGLRLCSLPDAVRIRNAIAQLVQLRAQDVSKQNLRIVIGGGGFTGVELAAELLNLIDILTWKYAYPKDKIELLVIEGSNQLLPGLPTEISSTIYHRLKNFGVAVSLSKLITRVDERQLTINNGELLNYDLLIWTGGVKSAKVPWQTAVPMDRKGRAMTNPDLTVVGTNNIFMVGDNACVMDSDKHPMPQTATQAIYHANYVADAIAKKIAGLQPAPHLCRPSPFIIPVRGKWAIMHLPGGFTMQGFIPWIIKSLAAAHYFWQLLPLRRAIKLVWFEDKLFSRND